MSVEIKHPSEFTKMEVRFFLIAIGMESKVEIFDENEIDGQMLVTLTKVELSEDLGCSSIEIRRFTVALEFSIKVAEQPGCGCKPPQSWSETEVCVVLVMIGMGTKVEEIKTCGVNGAMAISLTSVELEKDCGMTSVEVKKFQAVLVKTESGGGGGGSNKPPSASTYPSGGVEPLPVGDEEATASTYPSGDVEPIQVKSEQPTGPKRPVLRNTAVGAAGGAAVGAIAGKLTGDTKKGAKVGAAVGAAGGIVSGLAQRRKQRKAAQK